MYSHYTRNNLCIIITLFIFIKINNVIIIHTLNNYKNFIWNCHEEICFYIKNYNAKNSRMAITFIMYASVDR